MAGAAGLRLRPAVFGRLRHRGDRAGARHRRRRVSDFYAKWVATVIAVLLVIVVLSYRQTCYAYPNGGGAFAVSLDNFGENAALVAASALLVDYVMTVAVSVVAGVVAITSGAPVAGISTRSRCRSGSWCC